MNQNIIANFKVLHEYEKMHKNTFKANAYSKVIDNIELCETELKNPDDLRQIKGIGKGIKEKLEELLNTGKIELVETIKNDEKYVLSKKLVDIYGIGPSKINELIEVITSFDQLYLEENKKLLNAKQKIGLKYYEDLTKRIPFSEGKLHHKVIAKAIASINKDITFEMVGSYRRKNKDLGDIDILIKDNGSFALKSLINNLQTSGYILEQLASGKNKFMGICRLAHDLTARRIDILVADPSYYYFALLYFTGSYNFNILMRRVALKQGLSLSEYGFKNNVTRQLMYIPVTEINSEEDIFKYLHIPFVQPNKR